MRRLIVLVVAVLVAVPATACSGSSNNGQPVSTRLAAAKRSLDDAKFIGFTLTSQNLPSGGDVLEGAQGTGTHAPAFTGKVEVRKGFSFSASLIAVGGKVFAQLPFVGWTTIDPADYGAPDPAALMSRQTGLSSLLTRTQHPKTSGSQRSGSTVLTKIAGTLPGKDIHALFPSAAGSPFQVVYAVDSHDSLHQVTITGPFYGDNGTSTYQIMLDLSAAPVTITAPQ